MRRAQLILNARHTSRGRLGSGTLIRLVVLSFVVTTLALGLLPSQASAASRGKPNATKPSAAALAVPGTVSGTVTVPDGGPFDGDVVLYQWDPVGEFFDYVNDATVSDAHPGFSFTAASGDYYLELDTFNQRYLTTYSGGATQPPTATTDPGVLHVDAGTGAEANLTAALNPAIHRVTGTVTAGGAPAADADVQVFMDDGTGNLTYVTEDFTTANGTFHVDLASGSYTLVVTPSTDTYDTASVPLTVGGSDRTLDPIALPASGSWALSGTVSDTGGALSGATVRLYRLTGTPGAWSDYQSLQSVTTDANGHYSFANISGGNSRWYTVQASSPGHRPTFYGGVADVLDATAFHLTANRTGTDVQLPLASTIAGTVTGPQGAAANVDVALYQWFADASDPAGGSFSDVAYATTSATGAYSFDVPAAGTYALYFDGAFAQLRSGWLVGDTMPTGPGSPGTLAVPETVTHLVADKTLAGVPAVTGTITDQAAHPVQGASATAYAWEDGAWSQVASALTNASGGYSVPLSVPDGTPITLRFARGGFTPVWYGGGASMPTAPTAQNSITTTGANLTAGTVQLAPFVSKLGKVAGQRLDYCLANALAANDDGSSAAVTIPFELKFFGTPYTQLYVNNNGNVTFGSGLSRYTPSDLTGQTDRPIIAPYFADVDTRGAGSNVTTYGVSPDGNTLCVNWADVGYFSSHDDKLNTFQLLLTKNTSGAGRGAGDFDITFNYDEMLWETGDASGGANGFGGTPAAAGFSAGTGAAGTYVQLPGSLTTGALVDGGPDALVAHSQGSTQLGRYVFQVRNAGLTTSLGGLQGRVVRASGGAAVANAYVQACRSTGTGCSYAYTDSTGGYSFTALPVATYDVRVWPPDDSLFGGGTTAVVTAGQTTTVPAIQLTAPTPPPPGTTITSNGTSAAGIPSVNYAQTLQLALTGCAGTANPTYTVTLADGRVVRDHLPLTESPAGHFTASIAPLTPNTGDATITTNVPATCGGAPIAFNVYIDPSGVVTDQWGRPVAGATATLLRSDTENGTYAAVPDGSELMSPSNRHNPSTTDQNGYFQWDVQAGWYKVTTAKTGCTTESTPAMEVPPARIDLLIRSTCAGAAAPAPTSAPTITGQARVGQKISPVSGSWPAPLVEAGLELLRNGTPVTLSAGGYTLTANDVGASFTARSSGQRPDYVQQQGTGSTVTFTAAVATSAPVTGAKAAAPTATTAPRISGTPKLGSTLTASPGTWSVTGLQYHYQWYRAGAPIGGATAGTYKVTTADVAKSLAVAVTATAAGYADGTATTAPVTVAKVTAAVALTGPRSVKAGKKAKVTATVTAALPATGTVTLRDGKTRLGTAKIVNGRAVLTVKLKAGKHRLTAAYGGSGTVGAATSKVLVVKAKR